MQRQNSWNAKTFVASYKRVYIVAIVAYLSTTLIVFFLCNSRATEAMWPVMSRLDWSEETCYILNCLLWSVCDERDHCLHFCYYLFAITVCFPLSFAYTSVSGRCFLGGLSIILSFVLFTGKYYLIKNLNMEEIQGGHCPWSTIQGRQPTTVTPPCRAPAETNSPTQCLHKSSS